MYLVMAYKDSDYTVMITVVPTYVVGVETHLGIGVMSTFVFPQAAISRALASTFVGSTALRKGPQGF